VKGPALKTNNKINTGKRFAQWISRINSNSWSIATLLIPKEEPRSCQDPPLNHLDNLADPGNPSKLSEPNLAGQLAVLVVDMPIWKNTLVVRTPKRPAV
jgi:hypothetical protein